MSFWTSRFVHAGILIFGVWQVIVLNVQLYYSFLKYTDTMAHFFSSPAAAHSVHVADNSDLPSSLSWSLAI